MTFAVGYVDIVHIRRVLILSRCSDSECLRQMYSMVHVFTIAVFKYLVKLRSSYLFICLCVVGR